MPVTTSRNVASFARLWHRASFAPPARQPVQIPAPSEALPARVRLAVMSAILHRGSKHQVELTMASWDLLTPDEIHRRVRSSDLDVLVSVHLHEGANQNRERVLNSIDTRVALLNGE